MVPNAPGRGVTDKNLKGKEVRHEKKVDTSFPTGIAPLVDDGCPSVSRPSRRNTSPPHTST